MKLYIKLKLAAYGRQRNEIMVMEYGELIGHFKGKQKSLVSQIMYQWPWILIIGGLMYKTIDNLIVGKEITLETWAFLFLLCLLAMYMFFANSKTSELKLTVYSRGVLFPFIGFFEWSDLTVRRLTYIEKAPTVSFMPCFYIDIKDKKTIAIYQYLEHYTGLYHLLHDKGVKGASNKLLIYDTLPDGRHTGSKQEYIAIFDPIKNELIEEKGDPLKSPYNI